MRRTPVLLAAAIVVTAAPAAMAHGEFRPDRVARSVTVELDLVLPSERPDARTSRVVLAMPSGFTARECVEPVGWTCAVAADAVEWRDLARVRAEVDFFFTVTVSSTAGTYTLPVEQTYDDGTVNTFAGAPGSADEAPLLTVTGAAAAPPPPTVRPSGSGSPSPRATVVAAPSATSSSASSASAAATPTALRVAPSAAVSPSSATTGRPAVATAFARPTSLPRGELVSAADGRGSRRRVPVLLAGALLVLLGAVTASRLLSPRRRP